MNILVTGANGQLGRELRRASLYSNEHFIFSDISGTPGEEIVYLDVADKEAVAMGVDCGLLAIAFIFKGIGTACTGNGSGYLQQPGIITINLQLLPL